MICGYTDRYVIPGVKGWWRRWCWEPAGHRGSHFHPPRPERTFKQILADIRSDRDEQERLAEIPPEPEVVVIQELDMVQVKDLPSGPKKVMTWLAQNPAWTTSAAHTRTRHRAELYADNSKTSEAKKGDVKKPAFERDNWFISGSLRVEHNDRILRAHFRATWATVKGTTFDSALVGDNLEEFLGVEDAGAAQYVATQAGAFEDWLRALAPTGAPVKREKKTPQSEATATDLISEGEWIG